VTTISRSALVPRPAAELYALVNAVEDYPRRFAWCERVQVLARADDALVVRLAVRHAGIAAQFATRNTLTHGRRIDMQLVEGPFTALRGAWQFQPLGEHGCKVQLDLDYTVDSALVGSALAVGFQALADRMVGDFVKVALSSS
jgi:ribosome-associated toxin RatA of RatAB toxin-antitoxin module